jgi:hypothetical protein
LPFLPLQPHTPPGSPKTAWKLRGSPLCPSWHENYILKRGVQPSDTNFKIA